jgi:hypothetical protein
MWIRSKVKEVPGLLSAGRSMGFFFGMNCLFRHVVLVVALSVRSRCVVHLIALVRKQRLVCLHYCI